MWSNLGKSCCRAYYPRNCKQLGRIEMAKFIEKRRCHRFEIPEAQVKYKKVWLGFSLRDFSDYRSLENISKGGLAFWCEEKLRLGTKILVQIHTPGEDVLELVGRVRWQGFPAGKLYTVVGVEFMPFGEGKKWNSFEALEALKRLEEQYSDQGVEVNKGPMRKIAHVSREIF